MAVNRHFSGFGGQQFLKGFGLHITPSQFFEHIAYGSFANLDIRMRQRIAACLEKMGHEADRTKTIHSVNHPAVPYSYGIIAIAECLEKQCSDVSRTFLEKAVRPVFTNGRLIICVLDKASSLNDFPNDPKAFDLPLSCFLVLYVLNLVL